MIENMRKYTGLMVVVFVLLGAGFLFTMNDIGTGSTGGGGPTVLEVHGQSYDQQAYQRMGEQTLQMCSAVGMHNYINFLLAPNADAMQYAFRLGGMGFNYFNLPTQGGISKQELNRFVANRVILQHAIKDMGLYASEEEISEAIKNLPAFAPNGKYNEGAYAQFIDKRLGRLGMTEKHLRELMRENICLNKIINIVGGGLTHTRVATQNQLEAQMQTITLAKITFNREDFVKKEKPTEEEIKAYWEAHQDAYKTDEQRRISYYYIDLPKEIEEEKKEEEKIEASTPKTPEEIAKKAADDKAKAEAKAAETVAKREQRAAEAKKLTRDINAFYDRILVSEENKKALDFAAIVAEHKGNFLQSKLFTRSSLPKGLQGLALRGSSNRNKSLAEVIFSTPMAEKDYDRVSDPLPVGDTGWIVFVLDEVITPEPLDYEAARDKARDNLIGENATEKVQQAAKDARQAVTELMAAGKDFDTAAREKSLTPVQVGPYQRNSSPANEPSAAELHNVASGLNPGEVSETIDEANRSIFIYVEKRELEDTEENKLRVDNAMQGAKIDLMLRTFLNWINHQYQNADVKGLATE